MNWNAARPANTLPNAASSVLSIPAGGKNGYSTVMCAGHPVPGGLVKPGTVLADSRLSGWHGHE